MYYIVLLKPTKFKNELYLALQEIDAHTCDRGSGGYVNDMIIKSKYEADYMLAYRFRIGQSDLVYSIDSDLCALCGHNFISIRYFGPEKKAKR